MVILKVLLIYNGLEYILVEKEIFKTNSNILLCINQANVLLHAHLIYLCLFGVTSVIDGSLVLLMLPSVLTSHYHFKEKDVIEVLLVYNLLQFVSIHVVVKTF